MSSIYLINVGANCGHSSKARSPLFSDGSFKYVSYLAAEKEKQQRPYPDDMHRFLNPKFAGNIRTHDDPDWKNLTYGDICLGRGSGRGAKLRYVEKEDILLFWGLLWPNKDKCWDQFENEDKKGWYLLGALRVEEIVEGGQDINHLHLSDRNRFRAEQNIHYYGGQLPTGQRIFLGVEDNQYSRLFGKAVDLQVHNENGLIYQAFTSATGELLPFNGNPQWWCSIRSCRKMWDLGDNQQRDRANIVREAIREQNPDFNLLNDLD